MNRLLIAISIVGLMISSCKKDEDVVSPIPEIEFVSISSTEVVEFENELEITFSYVDGNGDIGYADPDTYSLRVKDSRLLNYDWYHMPPITPDLQELHTEGSFTVHLTPLFLLGNGSQESADFTLQIQDRSGNWSNQIITPVVLINDSL